jgi:hypothetical protein
LRKLIAGAALAVAGALAAGAWWAYREFCKPYEEMSREQAGGPEVQDGPMVFWSQHERRDT